MRTYTSCNCKACHSMTPSDVKGEHKKTAHRELRRATRQAIKNMGEDNDPVVPQSISTGYKA